MILDELSECILDPSEKDGFVDGVILRNALNRFVLSLPERTQKAFLLRYWYACTIAEVASELSIKESHAAVLLLRTREKLKEFLEKEGFEI
jgi:RNA polymerase sigma-70 factor (ECF subfamily)